MTFLCAMMLAPASLKALPPVMMMAVDQIFDWLVRDLLDLIDILLAAVRPAVGDRIRCDYVVLGDYEHRLVVAIPKDVDVLGAVDLRGLDLRPLLRLRRHAEYADQHGGQRLSGASANCEGKFPVPP